MGFRIVKINSRCKLETQLGYLVCRKDNEQRILLDEISLLIVESQQVCITSALLSELVNHKIRVIFCDSKHNPQSELNPYSESYNTYAKIKTQLSWKKEIKDLVWKEIVSQKINNQLSHLRKREIFDGQDLLVHYLSSVETGDFTNREGLAAKTYFFSLFGNDFNRRDDHDSINQYLNYGYSIVLSAINREIAASGYLNVVGIHHIGETNPFNLGCDLIEPFRPFVDEVALCEDINEENYKTKMMNLLTMNISVGDRNTIMDNGIYSYVLGVLSALEKDDISLVPKVCFS